LEASKKFYETVAPPDSYSEAKIILHQTARMLWLADQIDEVAKGRPAFQILFLFDRGRAHCKDFGEI
jgi:hypothetical protein